MPSLCPECKTHERAEDFIHCVFCREKFCIACEVEERTDGKFCKDCKDPEKIIVACVGCGNRFWLLPNEDACTSLFQLDGLKHLKPQKGMTIKMSECNICTDTHEGKPIKIKVM